MPILLVIALFFISITIMRVRAYVYPSLGGGVGAFKKNVVIMVITTVTIGISRSVDSLILVLNDSISEESTYTQFA